MCSYSRFHISHHRATRPICLFLAKNIVILFSEVGIQEVPPPLRFSLCHPFPPQIIHKEGYVKQVVAPQRLAALKELDPVVTAAEARAFDFKTLEATCAGYDLVTAPSAMRFFPWVFFALGGGTKGQNSRDGHPEGGSTV